MFLPEAFQRASAAGTSKVRTAAAAVMILSLAALAYSSAISSGLFLDDYVHIERSARLRSSFALDRWNFSSHDMRHLWWVSPDARVSYFRPLISVSFWLDGQLWGRSAWGYHLTNLSLHIVNSLLVYLIAVRFRFGRTGSLLASLLFLMHPGHAGAVQWISGRTDVITTLMYLLAFLSYLKSTTGENGSGKFVVIALLLQVAALAAKELAITFPIILIAAEALLRRPDRRTTNSSVLIALATVISLAYAAWRIQHIALGHMPYPYFIAPGIDSLSSLPLQFLLYVLSCAFMLPILPFTNLEVWQNHLAAILTLGTLLVSVCFGLLWRHRKDSRMIFFGIWFVVTLLPSLPFMMGQRLAYLPSVGFCLIAGYVLSKLECQWTWRSLTLTAKHVILSLFLLAGTLLGYWQGALLQGLADDTRTFVEALTRRGLESGADDIYIVDAWMPASLWLAQTCASISQDTSKRYHVLSFSPDIVPASPGRGHRPLFNVLARLYGPVTETLRTRIRQRDAHTLVLESDSFFDSSFMKFFLLRKARFTGNEKFYSPGFVASVEGMEGADVTSISFRFIDPLTDGHKLFLICDGLKVREYIPQKMGAKSPGGLGLRPDHPHES